MRDEKLSSRRSCSYYQKSAPRKFANRSIQLAVGLVVLLVAGYAMAAQATDPFADTAAIEKAGIDPRCHIPAANQSHLVHSISTNICPAGGVGEVRGNRR